MKNFKSVVMGIVISGFGWLICDIVYEAIESYLTFSDVIEVAGIILIITAINLTGTYLVHNLMKDLKAWIPTLKKEKKLAKVEA